MPVFHIALKFTTNMYGWVEQWYRQDGSLAAALAAGVQLAQARYSILGAGCSLYRVRVTMPGTPHAYASADVTGTSLPVAAISPLQGAEVRLYAGSGGRHQRTYFLRGLPEGSFGPRPGPAVFAGPCANAIRAWLQLLTQGWYEQVQLDVGPPWPIQGVQQFAGQARDLYGDPLDEEDPDPNATSVLVSLAWSPPGPADAVHVTGARVSPDVASASKQVNGRHALQAILPTGVLWAGTLEGASWVSGGVVQLQETGYVPITRTQLRAFGARHCGPGKEPVRQGNQLVLPGSLALPLPVPGPAVPNTLPSPPVTVDRTISTARELVEMIFEGYASPSHPVGQGIGIAQVAGLPVDTYLLVLSGVDNGAGYAPQQWINAISSAIGLAEPYTGQVTGIIQAGTPDGCNLILAGHSLGGITAEWIARRLTGLGSRQITTVVSFGSACVTISPPPGQKITRFAVDYDPVPYLSPLQTPRWRELVSALVLNVLLTEWLTLVSRQRSAYHVYVDAAGVDDTAFERHNCYPNLHSLDQWGPTGWPIGDIRSAPLQLGATTRTPWVHVP